MSLKRNQNEQELMIDHSSALPPPPHHQMSHVAIVCLFSIIGDRPYPCKTCEKTFKKSDHCRRHELTHVQDLACQHCGLDVLSRAELRAHVKTEHRNLRHFQCQICDHVFKEAGHLTRHMVTHTGEGACLRRGWAGHLTRHMVTHTGEGACLRRGGRGISPGIW